MSTYNVNFKGKTDERLYVEFFSHVVKEQPRRTINEVIVALVRDYVRRADDADLDAEVPPTP